MCKNATTNLTNQKSKDKHAWHPVHSHKDILLHVGRLRVVPDGCCCLRSQIKAPNITINRRKIKKCNYWQPYCFQVQYQSDPTWQKVDPSTLWVYFRGLLGCTPHLLQQTQSLPKVNAEWTQRVNPDWK